MWKKFTSCCQAIKKIHTEGNWFLFSASLCIYFIAGSVWNASAVWEATSVPPSPTLSTENSDSQPVFSRVKYSPVCTRWFIITGTPTISGISLLLGHTCDLWLRLGMVKPEIMLCETVPDIRQLSDFYVFQQDSAPAHRRPQSSFLLRFGH